MICSGIKIWFVLTGLLVLSVSNCFGQYTISSAGDHRSTSDFQITWTLGQVFQMTASNEQNQISAGIHQGIEASADIITGLNEAPALKMALYPNPVKNVINIVIDQPDYEGSYMLMDLFGKKMLDGNVHESAFQLFLNDFPNGIYFLRLINSDKQISNLKFIKK